jgi:hypothetical protein
MRTNIRKEAVQCEFANVCTHSCIHGAKWPHAKSTSCLGFTCDVIHQKVCCVFVKVDSVSAVDEYLKRLGQD